MKKTLLTVGVLILSALSQAADFTIQTENMTLGGSYASSTSTPFNGIALYGNSDNGSITQSISNAPGVFTIDVRGASSNASAATVSLEIDGTEVSTFAFSGTAATTASNTVNITGVAGNKVIKLIMKADNGSNDIFLDWIAFTRTGNIPPPPPPPTIPASGAFNSGSYRNMFLEAGYTQVQIDAKVKAIFDQLFYGKDETSGTDVAEKVYYPYGTDEAYIYDAGNSDVRSEGQSYGMMIALQMNKQAEFDKLWKFAKTHMQHGIGNREGYFAWKVSTSGNKIDDNTASDGEMYFATALYFASVRFGDRGGIYNYRAEADYILKCIMNKGWPHNQISGSVPNMFNPEKKICFVPFASASEFTDPSYYLPGFLEVWGMMANTNNQYWTEAAQVARDFVQVAAHPTTGLTPDYANYDGTARGTSETSEFTNDAMRTISNIAMDYHWFKKDEREKALCMRLQSFFKSQGMYTYSSKYTLAGEPKPGANYQAVSLVACNAVASLASTDAVAWEFIKALWDRKPTVGKYRYYDGMLQMLSVLQLSGQYKVWATAQPRIAVTSITVAPSTISLNVGSTSTLTATVAPTNATNKNVTWSSSNTAFATVNSSGVVTAISVGTATITAKTEDGGKLATSTVTVLNAPNTPVASVSISPTSISIQKGATSNLAATVLPSNATNKTVSWSTNNSAIATVSASGTITAVAVGSAIITVKTADGNKTANCSVTVTAAGIQIPGKFEAESYTSMSGIQTETTTDTGGGLNVGWIDANDYMNYTVNVASAGSYKIELRIASTMATGRIQIKSNTTTLGSISVPNTGGWQVWQTVSLNATLAAGTQTLQLLASSGGFNVNWINITSTTTQQVAVTGLTLSSTSLTLNINSTSQLTATVLPNNATNKTVTWSSSNTAIATVNSTGLISAIAAGTATITGKTVDGNKTATCAVTVTANSTSCTFALPSASALPNLNTTYNYAHVIGAGGPNLSSITGITINWSGTNLWEFAYRTSSGAYLNLVNTATTHTFGQTQPSIIIVGSGITGLDGNYWAGLDGGNLVLKEKTKGYFIYCSNNSTPPCSSLKSGFDGDVLSESSTLNDISIYPNPVSETLNIKGLEDMNYSVKIIDLAGIVRVEREIIGQNLNKIELQELPKGSYILNIYSNKYYKTIKFIKI